ncbi:MAG: TadE/TadG family type IV pilus assembly protein [Limimaricola soesokkakensis]|uniref:TadE/TadG family type IV pilus assembly protein n=1 Tax=Limimaricola soesokkakensis TaxID=1343159 RepID=UPI004057CF3D
MRLVARLGSLRRCEAGAAAVEFALIAMVAISFLLGIVEFGRALYMRNELSFAADIATRKILINPAVTDGELEAAIRASITFGGGEALQMTFGTESVDGVSFRKIVLSQPLTLLVPNISTAGIMLTIDRRVPVA